MKKSELFTLLKDYPDDAEVTLTVSDIDLEKCRNTKEFTAGNGNVPAHYSFDIPSDHSYASAEKTITLMVWNTSQ